MATPFKTVIPTSLRKDQDYYRENGGGKPYTFIHVGEAEVQSGFFYSYENDKITLFKSGQPHGHTFKEFLIGDPCLLRFDEFEAMRALILELDEYHFLIDNASHGVMDQIIVYQHLCLIAKALGEEPEETFARFCTIDYDIERFQSSPWT